MKKRILIIGLMFIAAQLVSGFTPTGTGVQAGAPG